MAEPRAWFGSGHGVSSFPSSEHMGFCPWLLGEATLWCGGLCSFQTSFPSPEPGCSWGCHVEGGEGSTCILSLRVGGALFKVTQPAAGGPGCSSEFPCFTPPPQLTV